MARAEFLRLSDEHELAAMTSDDLRSVALRYGLEIGVDHRQVCRIHWERLGRLTFEFGGDDGVVGTVSAKGLSRIDKARWKELLRS